MLNGSLLGETDMTKIINLRSYYKGKTTTTEIAVVRLSQWVKQFFCPLPPEIGTPSLVLNYPLYVFGDRIRMLDIPYFD